MYRHVLRQDVHPVPVSRRPQAVWYRGDIRGQLREATVAAEGVHDVKQPAARSAGQNGQVLRDQTPETLLRRKADPEQPVGQLEDRIAPILGQKTLAEVRHIQVPAPERDLDTHLYDEA